MCYNEIAIFKTRRDKTMAKTEVTVQVFDKEENIKKRLAEMGYEFVESFNVDDYYFSKYCLDKLEKMQYKEIMDNSFVLRKFYDDKGIIEQKIVHKKKELDKNGNVLGDVNLQVLVDDVDQMVKLFKESGLTPWCEMSNFVTSYAKGEKCIDIHNVKDLGLFIEYEEYKSIKNLTSMEKFDILSNELKAFNFNIGQDFSCKKVYMKFKQEQKDDLDNCK